MNRRRLLLLLAAVVLALAVTMLLTDGRPLYGTSCDTGERCERPTDGVKVVGGRLLTAFVDRR